MKARRLQNRLLVFGVLILLAIGLIAVGQQSGLLRPLVTLVMIPIRPVAGLLTSGTEVTLGALAEQEDYATLQERNHELERAVASLQVEIVRLREIEQDYYRLSELANYAAQRPDQNLVTADVIASDTSGYLRWVIINRGAREGIQIGAHHHHRAVAIF